MAALAACCKKNCRSAIDPIADVARTGSHVAMERSHLKEIASVLLKRARAASIGFCVTVVPLITALTIYWALVTIIHGSIRDVDGNEHDFRYVTWWSDWLIISIFIASVSAIYWGLAAALGRSHFLSIKSANIALALSFAVYGLGLLIRSILTEAAAGKVICSILGLSDDNYRPSGFDDRAPCSAFLDEADLMTGLAFALMAIFLLVTSLTLRIIFSHLHRPT